VLDKVSIIILVSLATAAGGGGGRRGALPPEEDSLKEILEASSSTPDGNQRSKSAGRYLGGPRRLDPRIQRLSVAEPDDFSRISRVAITRQASINLRRFCSARPLLTAAVGQYAQKLDICSSNNGSTRSLSRSAAVIGVLRS
jgi:hypothetical protein